MEGDHTALEDWFENLGTAVAGAYVPGVGFVIGSESRSSVRISKDPKADVKITSDMRRKFKVFGPYVVFFAGGKDKIKHVLKHICESYKPITPPHTLEQFIEQFVIPAIHSSNATVKPKPDPANPSSSEPSPEEPEEIKTSRYLVLSTIIENGDFQSKGMYEVDDVKIEPVFHDGPVGIGSGKKAMGSQYFVKSNWVRVDARTTRRNVVRALSNAITHIKSCGGPLEVLSIGIQEGKLRVSVLFGFRENLMASYNLETPKAAQESHHSAEVMLTKRDVFDDKGKHKVFTIKEKSPGDPPGLEQSHGISILEVHV